MKFFREQEPIPTRKLVKYLVSVVGCTAVTGRILRVEKQFRKNKDLKRLVEEIIEKMQ